MADTEELRKEEAPPPTDAKIILSNGSPLDRLVTVPMPRSLPELQHLAAQHFGHSGCLRLYRNGLHLLYHPMQVKHLIDGDVVIVRRFEHRPVENAGDTEKSTQQSDFVWHRPKTSRRGSGKDWVSSLSTNGDHPLDGKSRYAEDYVEHPLSQMAPYQPPAAMSLPVAKTGTTSYSEHFPWRDSKTPRRPLGSDYITSLSADAKGCPFDGATSYLLDYKKPPLEHIGAARALGSDYLSTLSEDQQRAPFDGCSTYYADYKKFDKGRQSAFRPRGQILQKEPFKGTSEYRREYLGPSKLNNKDNLFIGREKMDSQGSVTGSNLRDHAAAVARETNLLTPGSAIDIA